MPFKFRCGPASGDVALGFVAALDSALLLAQTPSRVWSRQRPCTPCIFPLPPRLSFSGGNLDTRLEAADLPEEADEPQLNWFPSPTLDYSPTVDHVKYPDEPEQEDGAPLPVNHISKEQESSRRSKKSNPSPSRFLIEALLQTGKRHAIPEEFPGKTDLSYTDPRKLAAKLQEGSLKSQKSEHQHSWDDASGSLQRILADYILRRFGWTNLPSNVDLDDVPVSTHAVRRPYTSEWSSKEDLLVLEKRGYTERDVALWCAIITAQNPTAAAKALLTSSLRVSSRGIRSTAPVPAFVFLFVLRRPNIPARALRFLLAHAWDRVPTEAFRKVARDQSPGANVFVSNKQGHPSASGQEVRVATIMDEPTAFVVVIRLLRHARLVWPEAVQNIAHLFIVYLRGLTPSQVKDAEVEDERYASRMSFFHNRVLVLLSLPPSLHAARSSAWQERAQFDVLQKMADHRPPLVISREGYRAVVGIQLARKKTTKERDWARLKAKSWPPWKEDKTGMDADKGVEDGISRAGHAIRRMVEAGYGVEHWEKVAKIFAGWDTDHTPTIQTRKIFTPKRLHSPKQTYDDKTARLWVWAARIEATRTIQEAWACFLSYEASQLPPAQMVYLAMFTKVRSEHERLNRIAGEEDETRQWSGDDEDILAGDTNDTMAPPFDSSEGVYVPTPPPSTEQLFDQMIEKGLRPTGRLLNHLLRHAESPAHLVKYLQLSQYAATASPLLTSKIDPAQLDKLPEQLVASFVEGLCRHSASKADDVFPITESQLVLGFPLRLSHPAVRAYRLLKQRRTNYRPAWNALLGALAYKKLALLDLPHGTPAAFNDVFTTLLMRHVVFLMRKSYLELDAKGFQYICRGVEKSTHAALRILDTTAYQMSSWEAENITARQSSDLVTAARAKKESEDLLSKASLYLRMLFRSVVAGNRTSEEQTESFQAKDIPRLLHVPHPAALLAYVRALGFLRDFEGIFSLVKWMVDHHAELAGYVSEVKGSRRQFRDVLSAVRVFLERGGEQGSVREWDERQSKASADLVMLVKEHIEMVPDWGGWPTADEAADYCQRSVHLRKSFWQCFA